MRSLITKIGGIALGAAMLSNLCYADQLVSVRYSMPVHVTANVNETGCNNNPGPTITLDGVVVLGGLQVEMIFENNLKGTHQTVVTFSTNVMLVPLGSPISIPKQPVLGGVGGNPYIWIQFYDSNNKALTGEIFLGRCVQGLTLNNDFLNDVVGATTVSSDGCANHPGPVITFGGNLTLSGLKARFIFRNNVIGTHAAQATADVDILINGTPVTVPKQPVQGGAGGNPLILLQFEQTDGTEIGDPIMLGRCNQI